MKIWINLTHRGHIIDSYERIVYNENQNSRTIEIKLDGIIDNFIISTAQFEKITKILRRLIKKTTSKKPTASKPKLKKDPHQ